MFKTYAILLSLLSPQEKARLRIVMALTVVLVGFEAASLLSIFPFLQMATNPEIIQENEILAWLRGLAPDLDDRGFMIAFGIGVFFVTVFGLILKTLVTYVLTRFAMMRSYGLSARLMTAYLHQPYVWFLSRHSSDLGNAILAEVDRVVSGCMLPAIRLVPDVLIAFLLFGALLWVEPGVAIGAVLLLGGAYSGIYLAIRRLLLRIGTRRLQANKARFHIVQESTGGVKELKLMGLEDSFIVRFRHAARAMAQAQTKATVLRQIPRFALESIAFGGMILLLIFLLMRDDESITNVVPILGLIAVAGSRLFPVLQNLYKNTAQIRFNQKALEALKADMEGLVKTSRELRLANAAPHPPVPFERSIEIADLSYKYPNATSPALRSLNLDIKANTTVGIVGGTGAGKTSLVDVILGLLEPESGEMRIDGTPITRENRRAWQSSLGYVPQEIFLTDNSIAHNIAFGQTIEQIDMDAVQAAAQAARLHGFVMQELPDGYATEVGERGTRLSGGQRQRVGIARALYHNPNVLIMDEATSALDNLTEKAVMEALRSLHGSKTILMIAHRLTTVQECDEIFYLEQGQVVARGTFEELIETNQDFRKLALFG